MLKINRLRLRQNKGALLGIVLSIFLFVVLSLESTEQALSLGDMNTGHEDLSCESCHTPARGTLWQQLQSNMQYAVGMRATSVDFGTENVDNKKCVSCHERANDRHPTHRFLEPRFKKAIKEIDATQCESCHREHSGKRLVLDDGNFCVSCHYDLEVKNDPLDVPHNQLIEKQEWKTCLQCHDFHGNHIYHVPEAMKDTIPVKSILEYFKGGKDPFSDKKKYYPLKEEEWKKQNTK